MKHLKLIHIVLLMMDFLFGSESDTTQLPMTPPLSGIRIAGELVAGYFGGVVFGITGFLVGTLAGSQATVYTLLFIGYPLGAGIGVYAVGNLGDETGSFNATTLSSYLGGVPFLVLSFAGQYSEFWILGPLAGAIVGFNTTRKYEEVDSSKPTSESDTTRVLTPFHEN